MRRINPLDVIWIEGIENIDSKQRRLKFGFARRWYSIQKSMGLPYKGPIYVNLYQAPGMAQECKQNTYLGQVLGKLGRCISLLPLVTKGYHICSSFMKNRILVHSLSSVLLILVLSLTRISLTHPEWSYCHETQAILRTRVRISSSLADVALVSTFSHPYCPKFNQSRNDSLYDWKFSHVRPRCRIWGGHVPRPYPRTADSRLYWEMKAESAAVSNLVRQNAQAQKCTLKDWHLHACETDWLREWHTGTGGLIGRIEKIDKGQCASMQQFVFILCFKYIYATSLKCFLNIYEAQITGLRTLWLDWPVGGSSWRQRDQLQKSNRPARGYGIEKVLKAHVVFIETFRCIPICNCSECLRVRLIKYSWCREDRKGGIKWGRRNWK